MPRLSVRSAARPHAPVALERRERRPSSRTLASGLLLGVMALFLADRPAGANLIQNGNFDTPDVTGSFVTFNDDAPPAGFGWTIVTDNTPNGSATTGKVGVDVINTLWVGTGGTSNPDGIDQSLDIDGVSSISQSFPTLIGETYFLELSYSHNRFASSAMGTVVLEGATELLSEILVHDVANNAANMQWLVFATSFVADSTSTTLAIQGDASNGIFGFVVDDISVVPEPATVLLLGGGLLALGVLRQRAPRG